MIAMIKTTPRAEESNRAPGGGEHRTGLSQPTALIVGSIIGVGVITAMPVATLEF